MPPGPTPESKTPSSRKQTMANTEETKLELFLQWLQANRVELRGCKIKYCDSNKGFGIFLDKPAPDGVLLVVPLDLAITPMRVIQDHFIGPECQALFEEGEVDDRFLMIVFLTVERLRKNSSWKPFLDMLPTTFGNPLWFTEDELFELKGTTLYRATDLQKKSLLLLYESKVKTLVKKLLTLDGSPEIEVSFEDFLWANSVFWTRALNIPLPRSFVFPRNQDVDENIQTNNRASDNSDNGKNDAKRGHVQESTSQTDEAAPNLPQEDTVWVEGLVPAIDFCNHALRPVATWEVDETGAATGVPISMYLLSAEQTAFQSEQEVTISYGNKGNEELLYLYGFVLEKNPDDYLMVHYPVEAINILPFSESKTQLLEAQKAELRCLLPISLLNCGFFPVGTSRGDINKSHVQQVCDYSWSGQRKMPSYAPKLVFPENFLTALRTIAMREEELFKVSSLLEELAGSDGERQPSDTEVRAAVWEVCGDSGALQLLVDLLQTKLMDLEESSGTEECDDALLEKAILIESSGDSKCNHYSAVTNETEKQNAISRNKWSSIVYRRGQKHLTCLFLKEAEHALQLSLSEEC